MNYQVSARKWRPQVFDEVVGQGHITQTLRNAIESQRIAHAYLFSGERGVGKTTLARIFSKALNCEKGPTVHPCNHCVVCSEITQGNSVDVIEIDGASNTGVDDIRELREAVKYIPVRGKYKVYIIDEVHMLSTSAFNALLKTLEEPPERVVFIFATTEIQKIPATILSRCQHFIFKRIANEEIIRHLQRVAAEEKISVEEGGFSLMARASGGSMRDALSLLDQAAAYGGQAVDLEALRSVLGMIGQSFLGKVTAALSQRNPSDALGLVQELIDHGVDIRRFLSDLVEHVRNLLVVKVSRDPYPLVNLPREEVERLIEDASRFQTDELQRLLNLFVHAQVDVKLSPVPRFTLELALVKATQLGQTQPIEEMLDRLFQMERQINASKGHDRPDESNKTGVAPGSRPSPLKKFERSGGEAPASTEKRGAIPPQEAGGVDWVQEHWDELIKRVKEERPNLGSYLEQGTVLECDSKKIKIGFSEKASFLLKLVQKDEHIKVFKKVLESVLKKPLTPTWTVMDGEKTVQKMSENGPEKPEREEYSTASQPPPLLKETLNIFGGTVVEGNDG